MEINSGVKFDGAVLPGVLVAGLGEAETWQEGPDLNCCSTAERKTKKWGHRAIVLQRVARMISGSTDRLPVFRFRKQATILLVLLDQ